MLGYRVLNWVTLIVAFVISFPGCIKSSGLKLAMISDNLTIVGSIIDLSGNPVAEAVVFIDRDQKVAAVSDLNGAFKITLSKTELLQINSGVDSRKRSFQLFFQHGPRDLYTASPPISVNEIGEKNLGPMTIKSPGSISAMVLRAENGQIVGPAMGASVRLGPSQVLTRADGSFVIDRSPSGLLTLSITVPGYQSFTKDLEILPGQSLKWQEPVIVFNATGPDGLLVDRTEKTLAELISVGHPTSKRFLVHASEDSKFIRYSHDRTLLDPVPPRSGSPENNTGSGQVASSSNGNQSPQGPTASNGSPRIPGGAGNTGTSAVPSSLMAWQPITQAFEYDFPASGGQTIYYQFTDSTKNKFSRIYQLSVDVDVFSDSTGIRIAGSSNGVSESSQIELEIDLPQAAVSMRISDDMRQLVSLPWAAPAENTVHNFLPLESETGLGGEPIRREIYAQFRDAFGRESKIFKTVAFIQMFKPFNVRVPTTRGILTSQVAPVEIELPPGSYYMRAAETQEDLIKGVWRPAAPRLDFTLAPKQDARSLQWYVSGNRQICVQLRDPNGFISEAQCPTFLVELFPMPEGGFRINGGSNVATSRLVELDIAVPPNATEMRIFENGPDTSSSTDITIINLTGLGGTQPQINQQIWLAASPRAYYVFSTIGARSLYVQFRGPGGLVSAVHQQQVVIIPMADAYGQTDVIVNNGNPVSLKRVVRLDFINIPETALEMQIFQSIDGERDRIVLSQAFINGATNLTGVWRPLQPFYDVELLAPGLNHITVIFRNQDRQISPAFKKMITYNPFPPELVTVVSNGGSAITFDRLINVSVQAPETAFGMRVACDGDEQDFLNDEFGPYQPSRGCLLGPLYGTYPVYVQLRTIEFINSLVFTTYVRYVDPFPVGDVLLLLNEGATETSDPILRLGIGLPYPEAAKYIRISDTLEALETAPFIPVGPNLTHEILSPEDGKTYRLYVQYKTPGGRISQAVFDEITYKKPEP